MTPEFITLHHSLAKKPHRCLIDGCGGKYHAKGYCDKHYRRFLNYGNALKRTIREPNEIIIKGDIAEIVLYNVKSEEIARAIIDAEDIEKVKKYKWNLDSNGYAATQVNRKFTNMQHIIMGVKADCKNQIDHRDRNRLNNRKLNFRFCTNAENTRNSGIRSDNSSGFKGVSNYKEKWVARIMINGKSIYLGLFKKKAGAIMAYNKAALKHHGEFAYLNKV